MSKDQTTRRPPPMQVVIKGWWVLRERATSVEALERFDQLRGRIPSRPWWRGFSKRWRSA